MRLWEYIRADHKKFETKIIDAAISKLKKSYSEHYKFVSNNLTSLKTDVDFEMYWSRCFFYRGTHGAKIFERAVRQERNPKDTHRKLHTWVDDEFEKIYGWRPRSQGLFATGDFGFANGYQNGAWIIFPSNGYKFIWSHKISDIFKHFHFDNYEDPDSSYSREDFKRQYDQLYDEHGGGRLPFKTFDEFIADYEDRWKNKIKEAVKWEYQDTDLEAAMKSGNEVMFRCQKYFAINFDAYGLLFAQRVRELELL